MARAEINTHRRVEARGRVAIDCSGGGVRGGCAVARCQIPAGDADARERSRASGDSQKNNKDDDGSRHSSLTFLGAFAFHRRPAEPAIPYTGS